jgi:hypothetical protein
MLLKEKKMKNRRKIERKADGHRNGEENLNEGGKEGSRDNHGLCCQWVKSVFLIFIRVVSDGSGMFIPDPRSNKKRGGKTINKLSNLD